MTWFWEACTASCCSDDSRPSGLEVAAALNSLHVTQIHHASCSQATQTCNIMSR